MLLLLYNEVVKYSIFKYPHVFISNKIKHLHRTELKKSLMKEIILTMYVHSKAKAINLKFSKIHDIVINCLSLFIFIIVITYITD